MTFSNKNSDNFDSKYQKIVYLQKILSNDQQLKNGMSQILKRMEQLALKISTTVGDLGSLLDHLHHFSGSERAHHYNSIVGLKNKLLSLKSSLTSGTVQKTNDCYDRCCLQLNQLRTLIKENIPLKQKTSTHKQNMMLIADQQAKNEALMSQVSEKDYHIQELNMKIETNKSEQIALGNKVNSLHMQAAQLKLQNSYLKEQIRIKDDLVQSSNRTISGLNRNQDSLNQTIQAQLAQINILQADLTKINLLWAETQQKIIQQQKQTNQNTNKLQIISEQLSKSLQSHQAKDNIIANLRAQLNNLHSQNVSQKMLFHKQLTILQQQFNQKYKSLVHQLQQTKQQLSLIVNQNNQMTNKLQQMSNSHSILCNKLAGKQQILQKQLNNKQHILFQLNEAHIGLQKTERQNSQYKSNLLKVSSELKICKDKKQQLQQIVSKQQQQFDQLVKHTTIIQEQLKKQTQLKNQSIALYEQTDKNKQKDNIALKSQLQSLKQLFHQSKTKSDQLTNQNNQLSLRNNSLQHQIYLRQQQVMKIQQLLITAKNDYQISLQQFNNLQAAYQRLIREIKDTKEIHTRQIQLLQLQLQQTTKTLVLKCQQFATLTVQSQKQLKQKQFIWKNALEVLSSNKEAYWKQQLQILSQQYAEAKKIWSKKQQQTLNYMLQEQTRNLWKGKIIALRQINMLKL